MRRQLRWPGWSDLRFIGNSLPVRATALVPFVGYLIIFNQQFAPFFGVILSNAGLNLPDGEVANTLWMSDTDRLYCTYFGLTFIGIGSFVFQTFCPSVVRRFQSDTDYINAEQDVFSVVRTVALAEALRTHHARAFEEVRKEFQALLHSALLTNEHLDNPETYEDAFRERAEELSRSVSATFFRLEDRSRPFVRVLSFLGLSIGFIFLTVPAIEIFLSVAVHLYGG